MGNRKKKTREEKAEEAKKRLSSNFTVSIAVPSSIIESCQSLEVATHIVAQVARAASTFRVDEIVVVDEHPANKDGLISQSAAFFARILQYIETPPYLRSYLLPSHPDLQYVQALPPLQLPHHLTPHEWRPYREGCVLSSEEGKGSFIEVGLDRNAYVKEVIKEKTRVTLDVGNQQNSEFIPQYSETMLTAKVVGPFTPKEEAGLYWGFSVRIAQGFSKVFTQCPHMEGYDLVVGTSERGQRVLSGNLEMPKFRHLLVAFGGNDGLEGCLKHDPDWTQRTASHVFNMYLNTCGNMAAHSMRTEDAVGVSLGYLQHAIFRCQNTEPEGGEVQA